MAVGSKANRTVEGLAMSRVPQESLGLPDEEGFVSFSLGFCQSRQVSAIERLNLGDLHS